jgi:hypothetical protein
MGIAATSWRVVPRRAGLAWVVILSLAATAGVGSPEETMRLDCGVNALYVLLRLEDRPVTLDRLEAALPPHHPDGYSMAELATAGGRLGLELEGVRFAKGDRALDRPAIAFLKDTRGGHFAVLRPVGTTGTMVQVIDPPYAPWIADYDRVLAAKSWTGRVLIPSDPWSIRHAVLLAAVAIGLSLLAAALWRRRRPLDRGSDVLTTA